MSVDGDQPDIDHEISAPTTSFCPLDVSGQTSIVFFDVETTSLGPAAHIVQLAACYEQATFCEYVLPSVPITTQATNVTKLSIGRLRGERKLLKEGKPVDSHTLADTCQNFVAWLRSQCDKPAILVAHNCFNFDMRVTINQFLLCEQLPSLSDVVAGFADTLPAFRQSLPGRKSYSQPSLVADLLDMTYEAHDAKSDVRALQNLVEGKLSISGLLKYSASMESAVHVNHKLSESHERSAELKRRIPKNSLSLSMADKIAKSGLTYTDLQLVYQRKGRDGLRLLLQERNSEKRVRVTTSMKMVDKLSDYFAALCSPKETASKVPRLNLLPELSAEKLALYQKRKREGYDLPDKECLAWLEHQERSSSSSS